MTKKATSTETTAWAPIVRLDLDIASRDGFADTLSQFHRLVEARGEDIPPLPFDHDGWYDITPQMAEAGLLRNDGNREVNLSVVKKYVRQMKESDWPKTGQSISFSEGRLKDGQHRLWACYLSGATFPSYVVASVPAVDNIFAYYDFGKNRTIADALHTAEFNGLAKPLAGALVLSMRHDAGLLGAIKQPRGFNPPNPNQVVHYLESNPDFAKAAHRMFGQYGAAIKLIDDKPAAVFFAWLVWKNLGETWLDMFCDPLGSGANLAEDSPILAVRNRLIGDLAAKKAGKKGELPDRSKVALLVKALNMEVCGQRMGRKKGKTETLVLADNEPFPKIEIPPQLQQAAE
jgi:hypothetical protein